MTIKGQYGTRGRWDLEVERAWGSILSANLLQPDDPFWKRSCLSGMTRHESVSLALAGRLLKYGQSLVLSLPLLGGDTITRLIVYLHRLRFDALDGAVRAPWLNHVNLNARPHVVFISRPQERMRECSRVPDIHARIPRLGIENAEAESSKAQTLILNGNADVMDLVEFLQRNAKPFVFVLDATVRGCDSSGELDSALAESFPTIPRIVLMTLGSPEAERRYAASRSTTHHWKVRGEDRRLMDSDVGEAREVGIITTSDTVADEELSGAAAAYFALKAELGRSGESALKQKLLILGKVLRGLTESVVPLEYLEKRLRSITRAGLYPVRSLERWLEVSQAGEGCAHGNTQASIDALTRRLAAIRSILCEGISGRSTALLSRAHLIVKAESSGQRHKEPRKLLVLCGTVHECLAIEEWFDSELPDVWRHSVTVSAMDGPSANRSAYGLQDEVIIAGALWPSRQHWLATPCSTLQILCHPFEISPIERVLNVWWERFGVASQVDGDKARLWSLDWPSGTALLDEGVQETKALSIIKNVEKFSGHYPLKQKIVELKIDLKLDDWLSQLVAQPSEPDESARLGETLSSGHVRIYTEEYAEAFSWSANRPILVVDENGLSASPAESLKTGQKILLLKYTEDRIATQEKLFEILSKEDEGLHQALKFASRWDDMVDAVSKVHSPRIVQSALRAVSVSITEQTIRNWYKHGVIGPRNSEVVRIFAKLSGVNDPDKAARYTINGIEIVRSAHMTLGIQIRKALLERSRGATVVRIGALHVDVETLDEMMEICTVSMIEAPSVRVVSADRNLSLNDVALSVCAQYKGRLVFTRPALKSMRDSGYREIERFRSCLEIMCSHLFEHFKQRKTRLHDVLDHFARMSVDFAPLMSETTMGRYGDDRKYKGRAADMNKHFILGRARDPTRTLRIHFEWDMDDEVIVIHHAGEHLQTTQS